MDLSRADPCSQSHRAAGRGGEAPSPRISGGGWCLRPRRSDAHAPRGEWRRTAVAATVLCWRSDLAGPTGRNARPPGGGLSSISRRESALVGGGSRPNRLSFSSLGTLDVFPRLTERQSIRSVGHPNAHDFIHPRARWERAGKSVTNDQDGQEPERRLTFRCSQRSSNSTANGGHDGHRAMGNRDARCFHEPLAANSRPYGFGPRVSWRRASIRLWSACLGCSPR